MRCAVIGAGAWGTALANLLAHEGHDVVIWAYERDVVDAINTHHTNHRFLAGVALSPALRATASVGDAFTGAGIVALAAPSHVLRAVVASAADAAGADAVMVVATKGIERGTLAIMTDVVEEELPLRAVVGMSGPSFAIEVASGQPTAVVAASKHADAATLVQKTFSTGAFRVYTHDDVRGVELGGALKNVMAIATGICEGLGLGFNSRAALITRGLAEMTRLGVALGARASTFAGLAGMGDLVLTCTGALSRNRALGLEIGHGHSMEQAMAGKDTVAEGVFTTASAQALAERTHVDMPIVRMVHRVLFEGHSARDASVELMTRELRAEQD